MAPPLTLAAYKTVIGATFACAGLTALGWALNTRRAR